MLRIVLLQDVTILEFALDRGFVGRLNTSPDDLPNQPNEKYLRSLKSCNISMNQALFEKKYRLTAARAKGGVGGIDYRLRA